MQMRQRMQSSLNDLLTSACMSLVRETLMAQLLMIYLVELIIAAFSMYGIMMYNIMSRINQSENFEHGAEEDGHDGKLELEKFEDKLWGAVEADHVDGDEVEKEQGEQAAVKEDPDTVEVNLASYNQKHQYDHEDDGANRYERNECHYFPIQNHEYVRVLYAQISPVNSIYKQSKMRQQQGEKVIQQHYRVTLVYESYQLYYYPNHKGQHRQRNFQSLIMPQCHQLYFFHELRMGVGDSQGVDQVNFGVVELVAVVVGGYPGGFEEIGSLDLVVEVEEGVLDDSVEFFDGDEEGELGDDELEEHLEELSFGHSFFIYNQRICWQEGWKKIPQCQSTSESNILIKNHVQQIQVLSQVHLPSLFLLPPPLPHYQIAQFVVVPLYYVPDEVVNGNALKLVIPPLYAHHVVYQRLTVTVYSLINLKHILLIQGILLLLYGLLVLQILAQLQSILLYEMVQTSQIEKMR